MMPRGKRGQAVSPTTLLSSPLASFIRVLADKAISGIFTPLRKRLILRAISFILWLPTIYRRQAAVRAHFDDKVPHDAAASCIPGFDVAFADFDGLCMSARRRR